MKTLLVMDSVSRAGGGLLDAERCLHQNLGKLGVDCSVFALQDAFVVDDLPLWSPMVPQAFPIQGPAVLGLSSALRQALSGQAADLIYRAGLWRYPSAYAHAWSHATGRPEIIAPHGMLDPWAVMNSRWKKRLAKLWFEGAHLRDAACIRALCESEAHAIRTYGLKNPICIVPNGIDLPMMESEALKVESQRSESPKILLFLGRIHPKKGLVNAIRAWHSHLRSTIDDPRSSEWQFVIAGWDQGGHETELKRLCREIGVSEASVSVDQFLAENCKLKTEKSQIVFVGAAFGEDKEALLRSASAFILPSFSEGLPMSVLEAWSFGLPVLMTDHCNLSEGFTANAALRIGTDTGSIVEGLASMLSAPSSSLTAMGGAGRALVERQFTWAQVAAKMKKVYEWVLGGGERPDCVR